MYSVLVGMRVRNTVCGPGHRKVIRYQDPWTYQ